MNDSFDVIIIGAGMGGLGTGLYLQNADSSLRTIIFEQHSIPGGYVTGFYRKGHYFDGGAEGVIYVEENQPLDKRLKELNIKQDFIKVDPLEDLVYPDKTIKVHADIKEFEKELNNHYPEYQKEISEYFTILSKMTEEFWKADPIEYKSSILSLVKFGLFSPTIRKYFPWSFEKFLEKKLPNEELRSILSFYNVWLGVPPSSIMAPIGVIVGGNPYKFGNFYPLGGMLAFSKNLATAYEEKGGKIKYNEKVKQIIVENGIVKGVETEKGELFTAKLVISNADLKHTYLDLIGKNNLSSKKLEKVENVHPSLSGFGLFLIVDMDLSSYPSHITIRKSYNDPIKPVLEGDFLLDGIGIRIPSNIDPTLRNEKGTAIVAFLLAPYTWNNYWQSGENRERNDAYKQLKEDIGDKIIDEMDKVIPGLKENIIHKEAATPLTFERYTFSSSGGWYGPKKGEGRAKHKRPFKNMILTGANVDSTGVPTAFIAGYETAEKIIKERKKYGI